MIDEKRITYLAKYYKALRSSLKEETVVGSNIQDCSQTLMEMDSLILKAYDLPPRLERKLLELFSRTPATRSFLISLIIFRKVISSLYPAT